MTQICPQNTHRFVSKFCCSERLTLATIASNEKLECLGEYLKGAFYFTHFARFHIKICYLFEGLNEPLLNTMLWVGGKSSSQCNGKFAWCGSNEILDDENVISKVTNYKLANDNMCLGLRIGGTWKQLSLEVTSCDGSFKYLCEESVVLIFAQKSNLCCTVEYLELN